MEFKKHISTKNKNVKHTENQDAAVNFPEVLPFDTLRQSQDCKVQGYEDYHNTGPIGDVIQGHIDSEEIMDCPVDCRVCNGRTVGADRLHINESQRPCKEDKQN